MRIFDSHFHILDPRFPLTPSQGYTPAPFTCADYRARAQPLGVGGGTVVSGSFQAFDQTYLLDALRRLGPAFVGVTQLRPTVASDELHRLEAAGVRAVRFNLRRGGSASVDDLAALAGRVHAEVGWHAEVYVDGRKLPDLFDVLAALPKAVIDHLGLSEEGVPALLRLAERGACVKATGFGRLDFDPAPVLRDLADANPEALLFGTDLPSTRAPRPFREADLALVRDALTPAQARRALLENAVALYRPDAFAEEDEA